MQENVFLGKVIEIDEGSKIITTDTGKKAMYVDNVKIGNYVGMNKERKTYIMSDKEADLYTNGSNQTSTQLGRSAERLMIESRAKELGIQIQSNMKDETIIKKIEEKLADLEAQKTEPTINAD